MISTSFPPGSMKALKGDCPTQATLKMRVEAGAGEGDWFWQSRVGEGKPGAIPDSLLAWRYCVLSKDNIITLPKLRLEGKGQYAGNSHFAGLPFTSGTLELQLSSHHLAQPPPPPVSIAPIPLTEHRVGEEEGGECVNAKNKHARVLAVLPVPACRILLHPQLSVPGGHHQPQCAGLCSQKASLSSRS